MPQPPLVATTSPAPGAVVPTIADVAAAAGVSIRTVSRVLNESPKVNQLTRTTVQQAIGQLGFTPSARARALASGRSQLIGVVQGDPNAHVIGVYHHGIAEVCAARGYELVVHPVAPGDPALVANLHAFVRRSRVDGLIVLSPLSEHPGLPPAMGALGLPAVALGAKMIPGYAAMLIADELGAAQAMARHLLDLGHRHLGLITGPMQRQSARERAAGFHAALAERAMVLDPAFVAEGDYGFESGVRAAEQLLSRPVPPTAIYACNDIMAAAVLKVAVERGLSVPRDLSVTGFDDSDIAAMVSPSLTTVRRPLLDMARRATQRLIDVIAGQPTPAVPDAPVDLSIVVRASTAAPAR